MTVVQLRIDELTTEQLDTFALWVDCPGARHAGSFWSPSTSWNIGGPIIERELIGTSWDCGGWWCAEMEHPARADGVQRTFETGPTLLVAAMRCYVRSRFGDTVELPV